MNILHLSDLHFGHRSDAEHWFNQLAEDLHYELNCRSLDGVILSGDIANRATGAEYDSAVVFVDNLRREFGFAAERTLIVPGNHDVDWTVSKLCYKPIRRSDYKPKPQDRVFDASCDYIEFSRSHVHFRKRFANFSRFHKTVRGKEYPLEYGYQYDFIEFPDSEVLILGLNSAWDLDHHCKTPPGILSPALNLALQEIRDRRVYENYLKIAVWHHPLSSAAEDRIVDSGFVDRLAKVGFVVGLHGHIHEANSGLFRYEMGADGRQMEIISAGTFGAPRHELPLAAPWQYNLLRFGKDALTVETRCKRKPEGAWEPFAQWRTAGSDPKPRFQVKLSRKIRGRVPSHKMVKTTAALKEYFSREGFDPNGYRFAVEAHIFNSNGKILLQVRGPACRDEVGKIEGVGGEVDLRDDLHEILNDRITQEIGGEVAVSIDELLEVRPVRFIDRTHGPLDWFVISYLCRLERGTPRILDANVVAELRFFSLSEWYALPDSELSRSTAVARNVYKARFGMLPYFQTA